MIGAVISHYRIADELGEGGMGIVYRAEDLQLRRQVAIKFLRANVVSHAENLARFQREARIASGLNHPNICTIHQLGEHDGRPFIVMEMLEGRNLKQLLANGRLPLDRALHIALQTADALEAAHARGIIHRDIKPANLFVGAGDHVKVLDFGVAKLLEEPVSVAAILRDTTETFEAPGGDELTGPGSMIGTAAYMSPEQACGEPVDARTDVFSLGTVLYEMVTGRRAVQGDDRVAVVAALLGGNIVPATELVPDLSPDVARIIARATATERERRYSSASDLVRDLRWARERALHAAALDADAGGAAGVTAPRKRTRLIVLALAALVALSLGTYGVLAPDDPPSLARDTVLLAPFSNSTRIDELDRALATALAAHLEQSPFLDIVPEDRIRETLRLMARSPDEPLTPTLAREVCQRLNVKAMLEGSVSPIGRNYVVALQATDCRTGESIAREQREAASSDDVLRALGAISSSMRARLGESLPSLQRFDVPIEQATTPSLDALKAYAHGVAERAAGRELESIAFFKRAIELDANFAAAHTMLSTVYGSIGEIAQSEHHARMAFSRAQQVSERERLFVTHQYHDRVTGNEAEAIAALERWKSAYPRDFTPANILSVLYLRQGRYAQAISEAREALKRRPDHPFPLSNLAFAQRALGQYDESRRTALEAVRLGVETTPTRRLLYQIAVMKGDPSAQEHLDWARGKSREFDLLTANAQIAAYEGRLEDARASFRRSSEVAMGTGLSGTAASIAAHEAWTEAIYLGVRSGPRVRTLLEGQLGPPQGPSGVAHLRAAIALARSGSEAEALRVVETARHAYPDSTAVQAILVPTVRAAVALAEHQPARALDALRSAVPFELGLAALLLPPYLRGEAYLALGHAPDAAREFRRVLDNRGVDPFSPVLPMAQLGLARALRSMGNTAKSREIYEQLVSTWTRADDTLAVVAAARAEYARLLES